MTVVSLIKTFRQNKLPFFILTLSFAFFLAAIMYGGRLIYRMEANTFGSSVAGTVNRDAKTVRDFFYSCSMDLMFIKNIRGLTEHFTGHSGPGEQESYAENVLLAFAESHPHYSRIRLIDSSGMERMSIESNAGAKPHVVLESLLRSRTDSDYYGEAMRLGKDGLYTSFFNTDKEEMYPGLPSPMVLTLASPVLGADGSKKGIVVADVPVQRLLQRLSKGTFFQNDRGMLILSQEDGRLLKQQSPYNFTGREGKIILSDTESVPYVLVEYLPGSRVWMARRFSSSSFKKSMIKLEIVSVSILVTFFLSVLILGFFNVRHLDHVNTAQKAIIHSLANLSEWRDPETGSHLERTRNLSVLLAKTLQRRPRFKKMITDDFIEAVYDAVPLHDIGKVGIHDGILLKSSRLSIAEFDAMKKHVVIGRDIIQDIIDRFRLSSKFLTVSRNICYHHHEKYDGSGYPEGLRGEDIPLEARIFAICDVYDALRAKRPYKPGLSHEETVGTIVPDKGRHFDPDVVDAFVECSSEFYEIFEAYKLFDNTYGKLMNARSKDALKIAWSEDLSVGSELIDSQHMEFISRVNTLFAGIVLGEGKRETVDEINFLHDYADHHFRTEERIMEEHKFPDLTAHKSQHELFFRNLLSIRDAVKSADGITSSVVVQINAKVVDWLMTHIMKSDKKLWEYIRGTNAATGTTDDRRSAV